MELFAREGRVAFHVENYTNHGSFCLWCWWPSDRMRGNWIELGGGRGRDVGVMVKNSPEVGA